MDTSNVLPGCSMFANDRVCHCRCPCCCCFCCRCCCCSCCCKRVKNLEHGLNGWITFSPVTIQFRVNRPLGILESGLFLADGGRQDATRRPEEDEMVFGLILQCCIATVRLLMDHKRAQQESAQLCNMHLGTSSLAGTRSL